MIFPVVGQTLVEGTILFLSDIGGITRPKRFGLVKLLVLDGFLLDLLRLLLLVLLVVDLLDLRLVLRLLGDLLLVLNLLRTL